MSKSNRSRRVTNVNANRRLPRFSGPNLVSPPSDSLRLYEDRRTWHPDPVRPAASFNRPRHRLVAVDKQPVRKTPQKIFPDRFAPLRSFPSQTKALVAFEKPDEVLVCVRRNQRREVMHATGKAGKRGQKPPRKNAYSNVSCKRRK